MLGLDDAAAIEEFIAVFGSGAVVDSRLRQRSGRG
jgi:hypothetical protein